MPRLKAMRRSIRKINRARLSLALSFARPLALLILLTSVPMQAANATTRISVGLMVIYVILLFAFGRRVHAFLLKGNLLPIFVDAAFLSCTVLLSGAHASPVYWLLSIPPAGVALYSGKRVRIRTALTTVLLVAGYIAMGPAVQAPVDRVTVLLVLGALWAVVGVLLTGHEELFGMYERMNGVRSSPTSIEAIHEVASQMDALECENAHLWRVLYADEMSFVREVAGLTDADQHQPRALSKATTPDRVVDLRGLLTEQQMAITVLRARGFTARQIAMRVPRMRGKGKLAESTINTALADVARRLRVRNPVHLLTYVLLCRADEHTESVDPSSD